MPEISQTSQRKVGIFLFIGVFLLPIIFSWFLLRGGHSRTARILGFSWLAVIFLIIASPKQASISIPPTPVEASTYKSVGFAEKSESISSVATEVDAIRTIEERLKENKESLKKYYATPEKVKQASIDVVRLAVAKVTYSESGKSKEEKILGQKAGSLLPQVEQQARELYASTVEEAFIKNGMDIKVSPTGKDKKQLRITYALMSQPLVYKFQNEIKLDQQARPLGFSKIIYTNGFESSLGKTWTVDL